MNYWLASISHSQNMHYPEYPLVPMDSLIQ